MLQYPLSDFDERARMQPFCYTNGELCAENVPLSHIAKEFGTPAYVYSKAAFANGFRQYRSALDSHAAGQGGMVCYAAKANSNLAVLRLLAQLGSGFDVVSGGELLRALRAGADPKKIVFSGVGKSEAEIELALRSGIFCLNAESEPELLRIAQIAKRLGLCAPVSLRVNPDVDPKTHPYISTGLKESKFGVDCAQARDLYRFAAKCPSLDPCGIDCHIGSQILDPAPFGEALARILDLCSALAADGVRLRHIDLGGGLGIAYEKHERQLLPAEYLTPLLDAIAGLGLRPIVEPGRSIAGPAGLLLARTEYIKTAGGKNFAIADAAMNDLMRPALYKAWHDILPALPRKGDAKTYDIAGPVCESGDYLGLGRELCLEQGDLLAIMDAGAYGMSMASNYNSRPRPAEVMADGCKAYLIRARETPEQLWAGEIELPE